MSKDTDRDAQRCPNDGQTLAWHLETNRDGRTNGAFLGCAFGAPSLPVFLLARLDEDEAVAKAATGGDRTGNWWIEPDEGGVSEISCLDVQGFITAVDVDAAHIARHSPARVLADVEAKRRIVALHDVVDAAGGCGFCGEPAPCEHLRFLAAVYADHEDYRKEWAL